MERQYLMLVEVFQFKFIVRVNTFETVLPRDVLKTQGHHDAFPWEREDRITCDCQKSMTLLRRMWNRWPTPPSLWPSRTPLSRSPALMWPTRRWVWMEPRCCHCYPCPLKIYKCADSVEWVRKKLERGSDLCRRALHWNWLHCTMEMRNRSLWLEH